MLYIMEFIKNLSTTYLLVFFKFSIISDFELCFDSTQEYQFRSMRLQNIIFSYIRPTALQPNIQAVMACFVTNLAACVGGITWVLLDYRHEKKYSALGFCCGAVAGLVCITPGSGYVGPASR